MTLIEEFKCEYSHTQPWVAMLTMATKCAIFQAIFAIDKNEEIRVVWQKKGWTKVETTEDWDKIKEQVVEQPSPEDNEIFHYVW